MGTIDHDPHRMGGHFRSERDCKADRRRCSTTSVILIPLVSRRRPKKGTYFVKIKRVTIIVRLKIEVI